MDSFFDQIVYSAANEDPASERRALRIGADDVVFCLTGSGARPLDLLVDGPGELVALDFNPRQSHLLELKVAAIRHLDHGELLAFLGITPSDDRAETFARIAPDLSHQARAYWLSEANTVEDGVIYCGVWESYMRRVKWTLGPRKHLLRQLITAPELQTQRALWAQWDNWVWRTGMRVLGWRWIWRTVLREPGVEFIPPEIDIGARLSQSFRRAATEQLLRTNPYYNLMVGDGYHEEALPLHLQAEHQEAIRAHLDRLEIVSEPMDAHLRAHPDRYTALSVSDFSSYASPEVYRQVWEAILVGAKDGARICERFFLVPYAPDTLFPGRLERDAELEAELHATDHTFLYTFNCATLRRASEEPAP